jgi:hypothetical protein
MGSGSTVSAPESGKSKKAIAIVIAVVIVIGLVGMAITAIVLTADKDTAPEKVLREYFDLASNRDAGGMYNVTIWSFNQSLFADWYDWIHWGEVTSVQINSLNTTYRTDMTLEEQEQMDEMMLTIEDLMEVDVQEGCLVGFNISVTSTDGGHSETSNYTDELPLVKIEGTWYIVILLDDLEDLLRHNDLVTPAASLAKSTITSGLKITILSITQTNVGWGDIRILLTDGSNFVQWAPVTADLSTGTVVQKNYSSEMLDTLEVCCTVTDLAGNGAVSGGDYFALFTYGGASTFLSSVTYTITLVYEPTGSQIVSIQFTG